MSTTADHLALSAERMTMTAETIEHYGVTDTDLPHIASYRTKLTEHGRHLASLAADAFETAEPDHPLSTSTHGTNANATIAHFANLLDAAHEFATQTKHELERPPATDRPTTLEPEPNRHVPSENRRRRAPRPASVADPTRRR